VRPYPSYRWPYGAPYRPLSPYHPGDRDFGSVEPYDRGGVGTYRTVCVRLCDGFYFPLSYATTRSGLARDADSCTASCGAEARLFYYPTAGGEIESAVDLTGFAYGELPNAFKYRKRLVQGCRCRPQPWTETELQRHRAYAEQGTQTAGGGEAPLPGSEPGTPRQTVGAGEGAGTSAEPSSTRGAAAEPVHRAPVDDTRVIQRPAPVARQAPQPFWPFGNGGSTWGSNTSRYVWPGDRYGFPNY
jgi:hypothetical protein